MINHLTKAGTIIIIYNLIKKTMIIKVMYNDNKSNVQW